MTTKTLEQRISEDFMTAFKNKDTARKSILGVIKGEIQNEKFRTEIVDVEAILKRMEKSLKQTNTVESLAELELIKEYLPQMMDKEEIIKIITSYKSTMSLETPNQKATADLMRLFSSEYKGKADNRLVMEVIKEILS